MIKHHISNGNAFKTTVRLGAQLYPARCPVTIRCSAFHWLISAIKHGTHGVTTDNTVADGHIFGSDGFARHIGTFQHDSIVIGAVNHHVTYPHVFTHVYINAIAVGVNAQIIDGQIIDGSSKDPKVSTTINTEIPESNVPAALYRNGFVTRID